MLYNPNWKRSDFSREDFTKWLGEQPRNKRYNYLNSQSCAVAQYMEASGVAGRSSPNFEQQVGVYPIVSRMPWNFGAAHDRAMGKTPAVSWFGRWWNS